jgi:hypothetical protein
MAPAAAQLGQKPSFGITRHNAQAASAAAATSSCEAGRRHPIDPFKLHGVARLRAAAKNYRAEVSVQTA